MTAQDDEGRQPGKRWLRWGLIVGVAFPITFGTFFGNILIWLGLAGPRTPGLALGFWAQTYFFLSLGFVAAVALGATSALLGRGHEGVAGWLALVVGAGMTVVGVYVPVSGWWLAGPLAFVAGVRAVGASRSGARASGSA